MKDLHQKQTVQRLPAEEEIAEEKETHSLLEQLLDSYNRQREMPSSWSSTVFLEA